MTSVERFNVWNPQLHFDVLYGALPESELLRRTLSFTLEDNDRTYDQITWELENNDGLLTSLQHVALGLLVRIRIGYDDFSTGWRAFVISRIKGGVGAAGGSARAIGQSASTITLSGRNRNAPDLKGNRKKKSREPRSTGKGTGSRRVKRRGGPSTEITRLEDVRLDGWTSDTEKDRVFHVTRISDAVREIARRIGYADRSILVQETKDVVNEVVIPTGWTYADYLFEIADQLGFVAKFGRVFEFHEPRWKEATSKVAHKFVYGRDNSILDLTIDGDFRLPVPSIINMRAHNPTIRRSQGAELTSVASAVGNQMGAVLWENSRQGRIQVPGQEMRERNLTREETFTYAGAGQNLASHSAQKRMFDRNLRALHLTLLIVGNPGVAARDLVQLGGTGTPLVDGMWYVGQAKHIFNGTTYVTSLDLQQPPKRYGRNVYTRIQAAERPGASSGGSKGFVVGIGGTPAALRKVGVRNP